MTRVIVCGSRTWADIGAIESRLAELPGDVVLVHGDCPRGADALANAIWRTMGRQVETHPAFWDTFGKSAGMRRNAEMAKLGAMLCIAFRMPGKSNGTDDMIRRATAAGIPTEVIQVVDAEWAGGIPPAYVARVKV